MLPNVNSGNFVSECPKSLAEWQAWEHVQCHLVTHEGEENAAVVAKEEGAEGRLSETSFRMH